MSNRAVNRLLGRLGWRIVSVDRLGLELEQDLQRLIAANPVGCVFDVGANVGQSAQRFSRAFPSAQIYSFEPVKKTFDQLQARTAELPNVRVINRAMGAARGTSRTY